MQNPHRAEPPSSCELSVLVVQAKMTITTKNSLKKWCEIGENSVNLQPTHALSVCAHRRQGSVVAHHLISLYGVISSAPRQKVKAIVSKTPVCYYKNSVNQTEFRTISPEILGRKLA